VGGGADGGVVATKAVHGVEEAADRVLSGVRAGLGHVVLFSV
jgi:hypothetical protein